MWDGRTPATLWLKTIWRGGILLTKYILNMYSFFFWLNIATFPSTKSRATFIRYEKSRFFITDMFLCLHTSVCISDQKLRFIWVTVYYHSIDETRGERLPKIFVLGLLDSNPRLRHELPASRLTNNAKDALSFELKYCDSSILDLLRTI